MRTCGVPTDFLQGADQVSHHLARVCGRQRLIGAIFCEFKTVEPYGDDSGFMAGFRRQRGNDCLSIDPFVASQDRLVSGELTLYGNSLADFDGLSQRNMDKISRHNLSGCAWTACVGCMEH
ncbi:hypothetical protein BDW69DRAFT_114938 [Aspergillus filifer]